ncbi:MAG: riboflavin biosynthesis protein RibF [Myxococcaceae bacterium]|nr:riboflavin biosynthesis protein RibF [Myxococcaceae bacterium]MBH2005770.1 riboflavin biosynthesis protein RibF [Myxococcaceae bacterium]
MSIVLIGNFDGLHRGHQVLIEKALQLKGSQNLPILVLTLTPHPRGAPRLMTDLQKEQGLRSLGVDQVLFQPFVPEFSSLPPDVFMAQILVSKLKTKHLVIGSNFVFGHQASGNRLDLESDPRFETHAIDPVSIGGSVCSSSRVRLAIRAGNSEQIRELLGHNYALTGTVFRGAGRGKSIGFATANLDVEQDVLPPHGVYAVFSPQAGFGACNIGLRPTLGAHLVPQVETHFLDFDGDLYEQRLEIQFQKRIRDEQKFASVEALQEQIRRDIQDIKLGISLGM